MNLSFFLYLSFVISTFYLYAELNKTNLIKQLTNNWYVSKAWNFSLLYQFFNFKLILLCYLYKYLFVYYVIYVDMDISFQKTEKKGRIKRND